MPGLNKKGPQNEGPMTGKRQGRCVSDNTETQQVPVDRGRGMGRCVANSGGRGVGCGMGRGAGQRRGRGFGRGRQ